MWWRQSITWPDCALCQQLHHTNSAFATVVWSSRSSTNRSCSRSAVFYLLTCISGQTAAGIPLNGKLVKASSTNTGISMLSVLQLQADQPWHVAPPGCGPLGGVALWSGPRVPVKPLTVTSHRQHPAAIFSWTVMETPVFTVDAFTKSRFEGNPAAVCPLMHVSLDPIEDQQSCFVQTSVAAGAHVFHILSELSSGWEVCNLFS